MTLVRRSSRRAKDVGSAEADGIAQLAQKPREGEIELEAEAAAPLVYQLAQALVDVERW